MSHRFGTSAPKAENGFVPRQIVSSGLTRRNIWGKKLSNFNGWKGISMPAEAAGTYLGGLRLAVRHKLPSAPRLPFRGDAQHRTPLRNLNLEIPGSPFGRPGMTPVQAFSPAGENR
jgi:hypothetical protein